MHSSRLGFKFSVLFIVIFSLLFHFCITSSYLLNFFPKYFFCLLFGSFYFSVVFYFTDLCLYL